MALTKDTTLQISVEPRKFKNVPMIASGTIYNGSAVGNSAAAAGYARALVAGDPFLGFNITGVKTNGSTAGATEVQVAEEGEIFGVAVTGATVASLGVAVYMSDENTFTLTAGSNSKIGYVTRWITGTTCDVHFVSQNRKSP